MPSKIATHYSTTGQADQFTTQQLWLESLPDTFIVLIITRTVLLIMLTRKTRLSDDVCYGLNWTDIKMSYYKPKRDFLIKPSKMRQAGLSICL